MKKLIKLILCSSALITTSGFAAMFEGNITVDGNTKHVSYNSIQELVDTFSNDGLRKLFPAYNNNSIVTTNNLSLRGLPATFNYVGANTELVLAVPDAGINKSFTGATRNESEQQLRDFFKGEGNADALISQLLQAFVEKTPFDPIAGNPGSMMGLMIKNAFATGAGVWMNRGGEARSANFFSLTPQYSQNSIEGQKSQELVLPIGYSHYFANGNSALLFSLPIAVQKDSGSYSYNAGLSMALQQYIMKYWRVTPIISINTGGSKDLGSFALAYAGFLKSDVMLPWQNWQFGIHNMAGYLRTHPLRIRGYSIEYRLKNWTTENGLSAAYFVQNAPLGVEAKYSHTDMLGGSKWYIDHYNNIGLNIMYIAKSLGYYQYDAFLPVLNMNLVTKAIKLTSLIWQFAFR